LGLDIPSQKHSTLSLSQTIPQTHCFNKKNVSSSESREKRRIVAVTNLCALGKQSLFIATTLRNTNTVGQNTEFWLVKKGGTYINH
jgi:hypothetical protein